VIGWLSLGLAVGFAAGFGAAWFFLRRSAAAARPGPSMAAERALAEPVAPGGPADEEIHQALDATKGLLDELEGRYRGRTAPPEEGRAPSARAPRRGPRKPPKDE
jgi:hypothetical protein